MAGELQSILQLDCSGGENTVTSHYLIGQKQSQQCNNFILDEHGSLRVRDGTLVQGATGSSAIGKPIVKIFDFVKVDGTIKQLAIVYSGASGNTVNGLFDRSTNPWTQVGTYQTTYTVPDIVTFGNHAL